MAVVVEAKDADRFMELASAENLEATIVATVKAEPRLVMKWNGKNICDISREFLNSNGAEKHIDIAPAKVEEFAKCIPDNFADGYKALVTDLNVCSKQGLGERFDATIGAGTVVMPFGGKHQKTPIQAMINKVSVEKEHTDTVSFMSWGFNPYILEKSPYHGAYLAVLESACKLVASGASFEDVYLTFQEYFEKPKKDAARWGKPMAALLGAFDAQLDYEIAAIGGKDSMSGSFENIDVPPTLCSFAVTTGKTTDVITPEFKGAGHKVVVIEPEKDKSGLPNVESQKKVFEQVTSLMREGKVLAAYTPTYGGIAEAVFKMCIGNWVGFKFNDKDFCKKCLFSYAYGSFVLELAEDIKIGRTLGYTTDEPKLVLGNDEVCLGELFEAYEAKLEKVYPYNIKQGGKDIPGYSFKTDKIASPKISVAKPKVLIPVFPGTNCEFDSAKAFRDGGAEPEIFVIKNLTSSAIQESVKVFSEKLKQSQIVFIPGGFSGGDEPDGSAKFITAFFRNAAIKEATHDLLKNRDGLMGGICNGFQALIKLGLVPYGEIIDTDENCPTLSFNTISRHQSMIVRTKVCTNNSPWLMNTNVGDIYNVAISHGEGRFIAPEGVIADLAKNGQIMTQYVDLDGKPTSNVHFNPNDSYCAIEGIVSPDGRVFGKMGHSERIGEGLYQNVPGNYDMGLFSSACKYFKI